MFLLTQSTYSVCSPLSPPTIFLEWFPVKLLEIAEFALDFLEAELMNQHSLVWVQICLAMSREFGCVF